MQNLYGEMILNVARKNRALGPWFLNEFVPYFAKNDGSRTNVKYLPIFDETNKSKFQKIFAKSKSIYQSKPEQFYVLYCISKNISNNWNLENIGSIKSEFIDFFKSDMNIIKT